MADEMERNQILSQLYALRASLSFLAFQRGKPEEIFKKYKDLAQQVKVPEEVRYDGFSKEYRDLAKKEYYPLLEKRDTKLRTAFYYQEQIKEWNSYKKQNVPLRLFYEIVAAPFKAIIGSFKYFYYGLKYVFLSLVPSKKKQAKYAKEKLHENFFNFFVSYKSAKENNAKYRLKEEKLKACQENYDQAMKDAEEYKEQIKAIKATLNNMERPVDPKYEQNKRDREEAKKRREELEKEAYNQAIKCANSLIEFQQRVNDTFSKILDKSDWKNLDILIYALQTKRAYTLQEALNYCDQERRLNALSKAISNASNEITKTLNQGFSSLSTQISAGFDRLSNQIGAYAHNVSTSQLYNYTQQKASTSVARLLEEDEIAVSQAKAYLDRAMIEMRNNGGRLK